MGVTSSNKQVDVDRIDCDGLVKVTLALSASPHILTNPRILFWYWIAPEAWREAPLLI